MKLLKSTKKYKYRYSTKKSDGQILTLPFIELKNN